jgi:hypothetical protein
MKVLVLTTEPVTARQLGDALPGDTDPKDTEVMVIAPAVQQSPVKFWFSDADQAIARAREVQQQTLEELDDEGVSASGDTGDSDPLQAIQDALVTFAADRIIVFAREGDDQGYREDVGESEIEERFGLPVTRATL